MFCQSCDRTTSRCGRAKLLVFSIERPQHLERTILLLFFTVNSRTATCLKSKIDNRSSHSIFLLATECMVYISAPLTHLKPFREVSMSIRKTSNFLISHTTVTPRKRQLCKIASWKSVLVFLHKFEHPHALLISNRPRLSAQDIDPNPQRTSTGSRIRTTPTWRHPFHQIHKVMHQFETTLVPFRRSFISDNPF